MRWNLLLTLFEWVSKSHSVISYLNLQTFILIFPQPGCFKCMSGSREYQEHRSFWTTKVVFIEVIKNIPLFYLIRNVVIHPGCLVVLLRRAGPACWCELGVIGLVWWHINHCGLFNAKSILYIYIKYIWFVNISQQS